MSKWWGIAIVFLCVVNLIFGIIILFTPIHTEYNPSKYTNKIDSLEVELNYWKLKKDSINNIIDTVNTNIYYIEKDYEKVRDNIINNSISDDYLFFTDYLRKNKERLDSINNLKSAKGN